MKPMWEQIHEWLIEDIKTTMENIEIFTKWIRYEEVCGHEQIKKQFIETLNMLKARLKKQRKDYKKRYGEYPKPRQLK